MSVKRSREDEKIGLIENSTHPVTFQRTHVVKPEVNNKRGARKWKPRSIQEVRSSARHSTGRGVRQLYTDVLPFHNTMYPSTEVRCATNGDICAPKTEP
jgi:hypothetical protein